MCAIDVLILAGNPDWLAKQGAHVEPLDEHKAVVPKQRSRPEISG